MDSKEWAVLAEQIVWQQKFGRAVLEANRTPPKTVSDMPRAKKMQLICEKKEHRSRSARHALLVTPFICFIASSDDNAIQQSKCCARH